MAVSAKILAVATTLIGGGVAIPICLRGVGGKGPAVNLQVQKPIISPEETVISRVRRAESIEKVLCNISPFSSAPTDIVDFVRDKKNQVELYSFVSCNNSAVSGSEDSYLGKKWEGLFPTNVLSEKLSYKGGGKLGINATTSKEEEENSDNEITVIAFSNLNTQDSIQGILEIEDTSFQKKAIVIPIPIKGVSTIPNKIYLFVDE